ncbi:AAR2 family protein [Paracoccidioides lutzii Pb01]|uniref:AAR2 family protein n=1 Tax=Paracoccidioides lutzii (strain ATCC MYA-826 / Pb01) TaxID=502779 RepID=C1GSD9_PARBA|nr:AAR2 family protein [Paracoccidioides lutzii Pb01]EEH38972.1 AAR2 family protein [Paracoccidioides lutzii Pb01]
MTSNTPTPTLLLTSLPPKTLIGIDLLSFNSTPNFHGINNLPPGPHFLYTGTTESFSLRSGEWFFIQDRHSASGGNINVATADIDIRLRKWDAETEALVTFDERCEEGRAEAMRLRANLGRIWRSGGLLAYDRARGVGSQRHPRQQPQEHNIGNDVDLTLHQPQIRQDAPEELTTDWRQLTDYISPSVLSRILGPAASPNAHVPSSNNSTTNTPLPRWTVSSGSSAARDRDDIPGLTAAEIARAYTTASMSGAASEQEREFRFLPVDLKRTWRVGAVGRERTEAAQDRSWALGDLVGRFGDVNGSVDDITTTTATSVPAMEASTPAIIGEGGRQEPGEAQVLGELQFTFLMVLTLMNFSCLEQWKRLLGLLLTCRTAVREREAFFVRVLRLLRCQLRHFDDVEGGLFEMDGDDGGALLRKLLMRFSKTVQDIAEEQGGGVVGMVRRELVLLEDWVKREYDWEIRQGRTVRRGMMQLEDGENVELEVKGTEEDEEIGEYAPVIVDIGECTSLGKGLEEAADEDEDGDFVPDVDMLRSICSRLSG